jgi:hypothetical protein
LDVDLKKKFKTRFERLDLRVVTMLKKGEVYQIEISKGIRSSGGKAMVFSWRKNNLVEFVLILP